MARKEERDPWEGKRCKTKQEKGRSKGRRFIRSRTQEKEARGGKPKIGKRPKEKGESIYCVKKQVWIILKAS